MKAIVDRIVCRLNGFNEDGICRRDKRFYCSEMLGIGNETARVKVVP